MAAVDINTQRAVLKKLSIQDLRAKLRDRGLAPFGTKMELVERLLDEMYRPAAGAAAAPTDPIFAKLFGPSGGGALDLDADAGKEKKDKKEKKLKKDKGGLPTADHKQQKEHKAHKDHKEHKDHKQPKDHKEKKDKKDKKDKHDDKAVPGAPQDVIMSQASMLQSMLAVPEQKKDKKEEKKDKKDKKEKDRKEKSGGDKTGATEAKAAEKEPGAAADEAEGFWNDLFLGAAGLEDEPEPAVEDESRQREAEAEAAEAARRQAVENEAEARRREEELGPVDEAAASTLMAQEVAAEQDPHRPRQVVLTGREVDVLKSKNEQWLRVLEKLVPHASILVQRGQQLGAWEANITGESPGAARRAEFCLRSVFASLAGETVRVRIFPEEDEDRVEIIEIPEEADGAVPLQALMSAWSVTAAFFHEKEPIVARPQASPEQIEIARALGLAVGQLVEIRFEQEWYSARCVGFSDAGMVRVEWLNSEGAEAEASPVDVRPSTAVPESLHPMHGKLVLIGDLRQRTGAKFQAMAAVDRRLPGYFGEHHPPRPRGQLFGFDWEVVELPAGEGGACARMSTKIATASEALVEVSSRHGFIAGEADERRRARALLTRLVPSAGPFGDASAVPEELFGWCSKVRVPAMAVGTVSGGNRSTISRIEDETSCMAFWLPQGSTSGGAVGSGEVAVSGGATCKIGEVVEASYDLAWVGATIVGEGAEEGLVRVMWECDGEEEDVEASRVRPLPGRQQPAAAAREGPWASGTRVLAVIGGERNRRNCVFKVMAISESCSPGVWTTSLEEAEHEARDGKPEEEVFIGVDASQHDGTQAELDWLRSAMAGQQALSTAARAAGCIVQPVGNIFMLAGFPAQRQRGREYVKWACRSRLQQSLARFQASGTSSRCLSVLDADMREDVSCMVLHQGQVEVLRPEAVAGIERETESLLVFDDGGGTALEQGSKRLLICSVQDTQRQRARRRVEALVANASATTPAKRPVESGGDQDLKRMRPAPASIGTKSDPRAVLKTISWPETINQWGFLQKSIWANHPRLQRGWIRCWSKSRDTEYYLRVADKQTTFNINEVLA